MNAAGSVFTKRVPFVAVLLLSTSAMAADQVAAPLPDPLGYWDFHGYVEAGGRAYIQRPPLGPPPGQFGPAPTTAAQAVKNPATLANPPLDPGGAGSGRGKFEEYGEKPQGYYIPSFYLGALSRDGLYSAEVWGKNAGYNNQNYYFEGMKVGEHRLRAEYDQTPHLYSSQAWTLYNGVGSNNLTINPAVVNSLNNATFGGNPPGAGAGVGHTCFIPGQLGTAACAAGVTPAFTTIVNNVMPTTLGIQRNRTSSEYRYTRDNDWEFNVEYSHERRTGTMEQGTLFGSNGTGAALAMVPRPVADTTQNASASAQYAGTSPWGKWTTMVKYFVSSYKDDYKYYDATSPFGGGAGGVSNAPGGCATTQPQNCFGVARMSMYPDNFAQGITTTTMVDLPFKSRYVGTFQYQTMTQNDAFLAPSINPAPAKTANVPAGNTIGNYALSRPSLDGRIDTILSNNQLTTQLTSDLKVKSSYRYYSVDNRTAPLTMLDWVVNDSNSARAQTAGYAPHTTIFQSYTKQNAAEEVNWRPWRWLDLGAIAGFEQYDRSQAQANRTTEWSVKFYDVVTAFDWAKLRSSYFYSERRYANYDWQTYVGNTIVAPIVPGGTTTSLIENPGMRTYDMANRDRQIVKAAVDFDFFPGLTLTPNGGVRYDRYLTNGSDPVNQLGLTRDNNWNVGLEATYSVNSSLTLFGAIMTEVYDRRMFDGGGVTAGSPTGHYMTDMYGHANTFIGALDVFLIPKVLDLKLSGTIVMSSDQWNSAAAPGGTPIVSNCPPTCSTIVGLWPDINGTFRRFDATLRYKFDDDFVKRIGWTGDVYFKVKYAYEMNYVDNWALGNMQQYMYYAANARSQQIFMAGDNPNYTAQYVIATLALKW
ncbi:MAG: MtrB/PioB family decaheme-associated outer membrane protein [Alphaproteobacteria bacterium]|nr:MAG: MtrB/PioB family decaheme-associated outer membrane protein [Alphaproteobacteria bacterium]